MGHARDRSPRRKALALGIVLAATVMGAPAARAVYGDSTGVGANVFSTDTLDPPSGLELQPACVGGSAATPVFVDATTGIAYDAPVTVGTPAGVVEGDLLLAHVGADDGTAVSAPGWTLVRQDNADEFIGATLYRFVTGSEPGSHTFTVTQPSSGEIAAGVSAYRGVDPNDPIDAHGGQAGLGTTSYPAPSITTTVDNTRMVGLWSHDAENTLTTPSSMSQRWQRAYLDGSGEDAAATAADEVRPAPGSTGSRTATTTSSDDGVGHLIALKPVQTTSITATWTATPSGFADGYRLERWQGGSFQSAQTVTPGSAETATDGPVARNATYEYRLRAEYEGWSSTEVTATVDTDCQATQNATALVSLSGESEIGALRWNNGFVVAEPTAVGPERIMQAAHARTRSELIQVGVNGSGEVVAQRRDATDTWAPTAGGTLATVTETFWWSADVDYESQSDHAVMVWANGSSGTEPLSHAVWNGTSWTGPATVTAPLAGVARQLHLAASPDSDEMLLVVSNDQSQDYALVWDGSAWVDADAEILDPSPGGDDRTDIGVAYEQQTGEAIVTYGRGSSGLNYKTWDGATWSGQTTLVAPPGVTGDVRWITTAVDPAGDRVLHGVITFSGEIWAVHWTGTAWQSPVVLSTNANTTIAPTVGVAYERGSGEALAVYGESGNDHPSYRTWRVGSGWSGESAGPNMGTPVNSLFLDPRPGSNHVMLGMQDDASDLGYSLWDGASFPAAQVVGKTPETKNQPFAWVWH